MAFGIVHIIYAMNAAVMTLTFVIIFKKYLTEKNKLTLIFSLVILTYAVICTIFVGRGLFDANTAGSMLFQRLYVVTMPIIGISLATFIFYPIIIQRGGFKDGGAVTLLYTILWAVAFTTMFMLGTGEMTYQYSELAVDLYSITWGGLSYSQILSIMLVIGTTDIIGLAIMVYLESDPFFKTRALLLFVGWLMSVVGVVLVIIPGLLILNPVVFGLGGYIMAYGILRNPPQ